MLTSVVCPLLAVLLCMEVGIAQYPRGSICQTIQYRALTPELQNEHQCMILEKLQADLDEERSEMQNQYNTLYSLLVNFQDSIIRNMQALVVTGRDSGKSIPTLNDIPLVRDCNELYQNGIALSGVYPIRLPNRKIINVWCDMDTSHGGWTVIQKRLDGSVNFTRVWDDYAFGFGNANSEYWLGNENLHLITNNKNFSIRFDIWDWEDNHAYALYDYFHVENEKKYYQLTIEGYSGTAGDAMSQYHNHMKFSTIDSDNDKWYLSCALKDQSGWWFRACGLSSLNGLYVKGGVADMTPDGLIKGIIWYNWKNNYGYSMKRTEIKIKPFTSVKYGKELDRVHKEDEERAKAALDKLQSESSNGNDGMDIDVESSTKSGTDSFETTTMVDEYENGDDDY